MRLAIDPDSPVPLYHQIAEELRARIAAGELAPGEVLQPLREAARRWGVHLHTVRHAYAALAREGLLEIGRGAHGTRVAPLPSRAKSRANTPRREKEVGAFLTRTFREAQARFGLDESATARLVHDAAQRRRAAALPTVYVTECSLHQCETHARELLDRYHIDARPWVLSEGEPPPGLIVATYFHYNDIRRAWPRRLSDVRFVTIHPRTNLRERIARRSGVIRICEQDMATAEALMADVYTLLGRTRLTIEPIVTQQPVDALHPGSAVPVLFSPRTWANLDAESRQDPRAIQLVYAFDQTELAHVASAAGWNERSQEQAS